MLRTDVISDGLWALIEPVMPGGVRRGRPWNDHRLTMEGIVWRFRTGAPWRDLPEYFGAWQSVAERHRRWCLDGTYQRVLSRVQSDLGDGGRDLIGLLSVDSTSVEPVKLFV